jgi:tetratricopeptide (TPR) repeat protein
MCTSVDGSYFISKVKEDTKGLEKLNKVIGDSIYYLAEAALEEKKYSSAIEKFNLVMENYPESTKIEETKASLVNAMLGMGRDYSAGGQYDDALAVYENIIDKYPDNEDVEYRANQEIVKVIITLARYDYDTKAYASAIKKCHEGLAIISNDSQLKAECHELLRIIGEEIFYIAMAKVDVKNYKEAIDDFKLASSSGVDNEFMAKCKYFIGVAQRMSNKDVEALVSYQELVDKFIETPYVADAYHDMYLIYMTQNNTNHAMENITLAVESNMKNSDYLFKKAELLSSLGKIDAAVESYKKLLAMLQEEIRHTYLNKEKMQYRLGRVYLNLGRYTEASIEFEKALNRDPTMTDARTGMASAQFKDRNFVSAVDTYKSLIAELSAKFKELQGQLIEDSQNVDIAKDLEKVRSNIAFFHYRCGLCYEQLGDYDKALEECRLGLEGVETSEVAVTLKRLSKKIAKEKPAPAGVQ